MTKCNTELFEFPRVKGRKVQVNFSGGHVTSDGGTLLIGQADRHLKLTEMVSSVLADTRDQSKVKHSQISLLRQRLYAICSGYEDLNDHNSLRHDIGFQTASGKDGTLASASTLCRYENQNAAREAALKIHQVLIEQFISKFKKAPKELILDFDATDDLVHGNQEGRFYHGYYDNYCFLPLYVFCGRDLLVSYLRPSREGAAKHSWAILSLLVKRFRKQWPNVRIIFRGDSDYCRWRMLRWCEDHGVKYIVGIRKNVRLIRLCSRAIKKAEKRFRFTGCKVKHYIDVYYGARTWDKKRRVIVKAEHNRLGSNTRFVITNLSGKARDLYEKLYCARGDMENRIKEQQLDLFSDRTSCHYWWANQFRLLLSSLAYLVMETVRKIGLKGTKYACAQIGTIRNLLLKIGAVIIKNTRKIEFRMSSAYPNKELFALVHRRLAME